MSTGVHVWGEDDTFDRQECLRRGIHYCEPGSPWTGRGRGYHPHAAEVPDSQQDGWPSGDTVLCRCPICEATWTAELPQ